MKNIRTPLEETEREEDLSPPVKRNLPVLVISTFLIGATWTILRSLLQPLVLFLGGSIAIVGVIISVFELSNLLPMFFFGEYSDTAGRRRPILLASLLLIGAGLLFVIAPRWWWLIPAVIMTGLGFALNQPASNAAIAESVPAHFRGRAFAYRNSGRLMAGVAASILGIIVVRRNIQSAFLLCTIFSLVNLCFVYFLLTETLSSPIRVSSTHLFKEIRKNLRIHPKLRSLYLYVAITDVFSYGTGWHLIYGLLADFQGVDSQTILLYTLVNSLVGGLVQFGVAGRVVDRTRKWAIVLSDAVAIPSILVCALFPGGRVFLAAFVFFGIAMSFWGPAVQALVVDHVGQGRIAAEFGKIWGLRGIVGIFPPLLGGLLAATYGYSAPLLANVFLGMLSISVAIFFIDRGTPSQKTHNPLH